MKGANVPILIGCELACHNDCKDMSKGGRSTGILIPQESNAKNAKT
jgi:hypothetical protein